MIAGSCPFILPSQFEDILCSLLYRHKGPGTIIGRTTYKERSVEGVIGVMRRIAAYRKASL